jgi:hypothetical protein
MIANPPQWAQSLLPLVVSARDRESVPGDLLEEYRETQLPARGPAGADRWYTRQVLSFLWGATRWGGLALGLVFSVRTYIDVTAPTNDYRQRAMVTTYIAFSVLAVIGFRAAWRSGRVASGTVVAASASLLASGIAFLCPMVLTLVLWNRVHSDVAASAALIEGYDVPVPIIFLAACVMGSLGGGIGKGLGRASSGWRPSVL